MDVKREREDNDLHDVDVMHKKVRDSTDNSEKVVHVCEACQRNTPKLWRNKESNMILCDDHVDCKTCENVANDTRISFGPKAKVICPTWRVCKHGYWVPAISKNGEWYVPNINWSIEETDDLIEKWLGSSDLRMCGDSQEEEESDDSQ